MLPGTSILAATNATKNEINNETHNETSIKKQHSLNSISNENCITERQWWLPDKNKTVEKTTLLEQIATNRAILLGEHHNNEEHHRWHLQTIKSLHKIKKNIALGFEMFPRRLQPVLDEWIAGKLSEQNFLKKLDWDSFWSFDVSLYMPLFNYARTNHIPMHALNVDRSLMESVRKLGWDAIPADKKEGLTDPAAPSKDYLKILAASYLRHNPINPQNADPSSYNFKEDGEKFFLFVQGQLLWDRAMAEGVASVTGKTVTDKTTAPLFIGIMGSWHIINRLGVPHQLSSLGVNETAVLVPWDKHFECSQITSAFADAIYGTPTN